MKIKLILTITALAAVISMLFSCQIPGMGGTGGNQNENNEYSRIVYADSKLDLVDVRDALSDIVGGVVAVAPDTSEAEDGEIVFGDTIRPITALAKSALESELSKLDEYDVGYIVYCDGKNIAVYWNNSSLSEIAVNAFITEFLSGKSLDIENGIALTGFYNSDDAAIEAAWAKIESKVSSDVLAALRELHAYYDGTAIAGWVANLYDPEIGGFYYSISARDNEPFRPDIESTSQALSIMGECGAKFDRNTDLPENIKADIVAFIKSCQSPVDGYFYHPQWPQGKENLNTDRYGRDMGSATNLIKRFTLDTDGDGVQEAQYPNYCTLETKCEKHDGTSSKCVFPVAEVQSLTSAVSGDSVNVTDVIGVSVSSAVSKVREGASAVIAAATVSSHPDYSSREAFKTWLYAYNTEEKLRKSSGNAHNLAALYDEIRIHGMQDILFDQLDEFQQMLFEEQSQSGVTPTGGWQETADYQAVWGMYKYIYCYNSTGGRALNPEYFPYMVRTALEVINQPLTTNKHMNDIMNQWACISGMITNAKRYNPDAVEEIYAIIREDAAAAIESTITKLEMYKISDGSIGYSTTGNSLTSIYGVPISLGEVEGDCNAVHLCLCLYGNISACLGISGAPIMKKSDIELFTKTISTLDPVVKEEMVIETDDFEDGNNGSVSHSGGSGTSSAVITDDPVDSSNQALYFTSAAGNTGSNLSVNPKSIGGGCYIFESRIFVESVAESDYFAQLIMHSKCYAISMHKVGNKIELRECSTTSTGATYNPITRVSMGEWFTLRIEYYTPNEDYGDELAHIKVWVNDTLVLNNSTFYYNHHTGAAPSTNIMNVEFRSMMRAETAIYVDDVYCAKETKTFDPSDTSISDARGAR